jgi:hypothetical protein
MTVAADLWVTTTPETGNFYTPVDVLPYGYLTNTYGSTYTYGSLFLGSDKFIPTASLFVTATPQTGNFGTSQLL